MRYRAFRTKKDNNFHFQFLTENGDPILKSQAYADKNACFNGIKSVMKNAGDTSRYEKMEEGGKHFFIIRAGNNQEIGRSVAYNSSADADRGIALMQAEGPTAKNNADKGTSTTTQKAAASTPPPVAPTPEKEQKKPASGADDYKPLAYYESRISGKDNGFESFAADGEYYFTYNSGGKVILISEGYSSESSRDNGISSVTKNIGAKGRVKKEVHKNGKHYFRVVAGNHQEIATSRWYDNEGEMDKMIATLQSGGSGTAQNLSAAAPAATGSKAETPKKEAAAPKKEKKAKKPAAERKYLRQGVSYPCSEIVFDTFQSGGNEKYYFVFRTKDDKAILINGDVRGHATVEELNSTIEEVLKYGPDKKNYLIKETKNGKPYFYIKNAEDKNIARSSLFYASKEEMDAAIKLLACGAGMTKAAPAAAAAAAPAAPAAKVVDEYLECSAYKGGAGFHKFKHDNGEYYFAYNDDNGKTYLRSEGYTSESGRDNGINSVIKNAPNDERWRAKNEDGKYFFVLRAGNNQEIARSCPYDSEAAMMKDFAWVRGDRSTIGQGAALVGGVWMTGFALRAQEQEKQATMAAEDTARLKAEAEAKAKAEAERLRAEAEAKAKTEEARLRAEAEAKAKADAERRKAESEARRKAEEEARRKAEEEAIEKARIAAEARRKEQEALRIKMEAEAKAKAEAEAKKAEAARLAALAAAAAAVPIVTKKVTVEKKEVIKEKEKEDDYLPCKEYEGHPVNDKENNIAFFKHSNGQLYFAVYDKDGKVRLRSEGFKDAKTRDEEVSGVIKNINNREMYSTIRRGNYYINILEDKTGREVGRSCLLKDKVAPVPPVAAVAAAAAAPVVIKKVVEKKPEPPKPKEKEDDYLPCEAYANHKVTDKKNNIAQFTHKNGQHYFAVYHEKTGKVRLRSEGFTDKNKLNSELNAVIKYLNDKDRYETIRRGKYYINVLKDTSGREVGRSCLLKDKVSPIVVAPVAAVAAAAVVKPTPPPPPPPVVVAEKKKEKPKPVAAAPVAAAATSGGCLRLWPLLLALLLLLLLLLLWFKGCFGCAAAPPVAPVAPPPVVAPVAPPVKVAVCPAAGELKLNDGIGTQVADYLADPESTFPKRFNVGGINYDKNGTRLNSRAKKQLDDLATCLKGCNNIEADVYGYISGNEQGSYRGNKEITLDDVRARGVVDYLKSRGIDTDRLNFEGGGTNDNGGISIEIDKR